MNYGYTNNGLQLPPYSVAIISEGTVEAPTRVDYYGLEFISPGANLGSNQLTTKAAVLAAGGYLVASLHVAGGGMQTRLVWAQR